jgi:hypothetical protein
MKFQHRNQHIRGIRIERKNDSTFFNPKTKYKQNRNFSYYTCQRKRTKMKMMANEAKDKGFLS